MASPARQIEQADEAAMPRAHPARPGGRFAVHGARRRLTPAGADAHSQAVRRLRIVVPTVAVALLAAYGVSAAPTAVDTEFLRQFSDSGVAGREMVLDRPRYVGQSGDGRAFEVSAQAARRNPDAPNLVRFDNPEARRDGDTQKGLSVRAASGTYDSDAKLFDLDRDVSLVQGIGGQDFTLRTDAARLDVENRTISSSSRVRGVSDSGEVEADSLEVYEDEGRVVLEGNVRLRFDPTKAPSRSAGATTGE